jgi:hypothetical protein
MGLEGRVADLLFRAQMLDESPPSGMNRADICSYGRKPLRPQMGHDCWGLRSKCGKQQRNFADAAGLSMAITAWSVGGCISSFPGNCTVLFASLAYWASFAQHPLPDIRRTSKHRDALCSAGVKEANRFEIHEIHFLQIQSNWGFTLLDLGSHLIEVLTSQFPA